MADIVLDVWLYGALARYGGDAAEASFANLTVHLPEGSTMADLLARLEMPTEARGITFIDGQLSAMPGVQPDLGHILRDQNRVAFFHLQSMWPFQYRHGVQTTEAMAQAMADKNAEGIHHTYQGKR
jgi:hypothetical protein